MDNRKSLDEIRENATDNYGKEVQGEYSVEDSEKTLNELTAYDIAVFYNTYNLSSLMKWWGRKLVVPDFQRAFVWNQIQASEFVDSILRGLPVPSMFFYDDIDNNRFLVIDGQQRLTSLYRYIEKKTFNDKAFKLVGNIHPRWENKAFDDLSEEDRERLEDTLLNITVMRQLKPSDGQSSMYLAFQRINTGGKMLNPQEIRMAVSYGGLSELLIELAINPIFDKWSFLRTSIDVKNKNYSRIQELIVRFWTFFFAAENGITGTLRSSLDDFFSNNKDFDSPKNRKVSILYHSEQELRDLFNTVLYLNDLSSADFIPDTIPTSMFFESVWLGAAFRKQAGKIVNSEILRNKIHNWKSVVGEEEYFSMFRARRSSSIESINNRITSVKEYFIED